VSSKNRNEKSIEQKLLDLDAHMYLLRQHLHKLHDSKSHLKVIAAELRTLVCKSSGTEGLLWRLADELNVGDLVALHLPGKLKQDHPLVRGLEFMIVPVFRAGKGDPRVVPGNYSFRAVIKDAEALVALGKPLTHEYLIKAVAQQMGTAHEDDGLEPALVQLSAIFVNGVEPYLGVLAMDAELTLEVGERVLEAAETRGLLDRPSHSHDYGNVSVVVRVCRKQHLGSRVHLFRYHSYTSEATVIGLATPTGVLFQLSKRKQPIVELLAPYPKSCTLGEDAIAVLSYCSRTGEVRTITADGPTAPQLCKLGWVHASELALEEISELDKEIVEQRFLLTYERLLSTRDVLELLALPPNGYGLWKHSDELQAQGAFPE
jgi:hypothetical protein